MSDDPVRIEPAIRLDFEEGDEDKEVVVSAFKGTGLPVYVRPDYPPPTQRGGGAGFVIDLLVQHLSAVGDGLIGAAAWIALSKAAQVLRGKYGALRVKVHAMPNPTPEEPLPLTVVVEYMMSLQGELPDFIELKRDFDTTIQEVIERHKDDPERSDRWVTYSITITRRLGSADPANPSD
jgi:hypothetical protein